MSQRLSSLLGELEEPVHTLSSGEGLLMEATTTGMRVRSHVRAGNSASDNSGEGSGGTDRH